MVPGGGGGGGGPFTGNPNCGGGQKVYPAQTSLLHVNERPPKLLYSGMVRKRVAARHAGSGLQRAHTLGDGGDRQICSYIEIYIEIHTYR